MLFEKTGQASNILSGLRTIKAGADTSEARKVAVAAAVLEFLEEKLAADATIEAKLDFRDYIAGGEVVSDEGGRVRVRNFDHRWLVISGKLPDGRLLNLYVVQYARRHEKNKFLYTKVREKLVERITVKISDPEPIEASGYRRPMIEERGDGVAVETSENAGGLTLTATTPCATRVGGFIKSNHEGELLDGAMVAGFLESMADKLADTVENAR